MQGAPKAIRVSFGHHCGLSWGQGSKQGTSKPSTEVYRRDRLHWCAAQIGIEDEDLRGRCIQLGERLALYKDYPVSKGCTSPYLPIWIGSVVGKKEMGNEKND
jgi:hypothetical protein